MTPLLNYANNITPAQAVANAVFGAVVVPELQAAYGLPNGTVLAAVGFNAGGVPLPGPLYRSIRSATLAVEGGAGITAGSMRVLALRPDGNWHVISITLAIGAGSNAYHSLGPGASIGNFTMNAGGLPLYGLALQVVVAMTGGNVNFLEVSSTADAIDAGFIYGSKLGALIQ